MRKPFLVAALIAVALASGGYIYSRFESENVKCLKACKELHNQCLKVLASGTSIGQWRPRDASECQLTVIICSDDCNHK
jgi:hypothetical protein